MKPSTFRSRRRALLRHGGKNGVDAYLITRPVDVSWLSGFSGEDSALLAANGWSLLITDFRFQEQAPQECPGTEIHIRPSGRTLEQEVARVIGERRLRSVGVQQDHMTIGQQQSLRKRLRGRRVVPVEDGLPELRRVKDEEEIRLTRKAVRIAERAFEELIAGGAAALVGKTEREIAAKLEFNMRVAGGDGPAFETIVAAGPNSSMCHYRPGGRRVRKGEAVLIDWGAETDGYRSDMTRVVFTGKPSDTMREIYGVVLEAHDAAVAAIRPGVRCTKIDTVARSIIERAGHGERFGHSLGHGIGREIHEKPRLAPTGRETLRRNMIVTVEPGIYVPGVGGVRIEDDILVTAAGRKRLNRLPRSLERMILS